MSILRFQTETIESPFGQEAEHYFALLQGEAEDFDQKLACSSETCEWRGKLSEAKSKTVQSGDFSDWEKLRCPRCHRGLKSIPEAPDDSARNRT